MPKLAKSTDALSDEAKKILLAGFRASTPSSLVALQIKSVTGEEVPERTIARRAAEWRAEQSRRRAAREQMEDLVNAMKAGNWSAAEMIQALATEALMLNPEALSGADPLRVQAQNLRAEELRIKREEMELRRRAVDLDEKRLAVLMERERRAVSAADELEKKAGRGENISAEDISRIREIYGLGGA